MGVREEFEKVWFEGLDAEPMRDEFLRGAKWAFERAAKESDKWVPSSKTPDISSVIRALAKEIGE